MKKTLTRPELRQLLRTACPDDASLQEFLGAHFPEVGRRLTDGMDRVRKENVVLEQLADDRRFAQLLGASRR